MRSSLLRRTWLFSGGEDQLSFVSGGVDFAPALTSHSLFIFLNARAAAE